jgi:hypothetical protein
MGDYAVPTQQAALVTLPTLVLAGGADFPWILEAAHALTAALLCGQFRHLAGPGHNVDPTVLAAALMGFFNG